MSRIEAAYEESDQRKYWVPCPTCRKFQILKFAQLRWPNGDGGRPITGLKLSEGVAAARLEAYSRMAQAG